MKKRGVVHSVEGGCKWKICSTIFYHTKLWPIFCATIRSELCLSAFTQIFLPGCNPCFLKMRVTPNIKQASVKKFAHATYADGSVIHSDGYRSYIPALKTYAHEHKSYDPDSGLLHWLHIVISNAKAFILGTYHGLPKKYFHSYLDEYSFHFCRRNFGDVLMNHLPLAVSRSLLAD